MPGIECFTIPGLECWFWSDDHEPPHFHVKRRGEWELKVQILACNDEDSFELQWGTAPKAKVLRTISSAFGPEADRGSIVDAYLAGDVLVVRGPRQRVLHAPVAAIPALRGHPEEALRHFRIDPDGSYIYWPDMDVHLGWHQILQAVDPAELHKAQQRSAAFNRQYGAAIRKLREEAGISQSRIEGLSPRQVRRIEQGECRATASALAAFASAHGMDVNRYMDQLAKTMRQ